MLPTKSLNIALSLKERFFFSLFENGGDIGMGSPSHTTDFRQGNKDSQN